MVNLSIIIVNWNSLDYARECLASIFSNRQGLDLEVIVVDNASTTGDPNSLSVLFPQVRLIRSAENLGFAGANNRGFQESSGDSLLFLNPDTIVLETALFEMLSSLKSLPDAGAVGCKLLNTDGTIQTSCIQRFPTIWNQVLDAEALRRRWPHWKFWGIAPLFSESTEPAPVEVISGACLMIRRDVFQAVGQFSREYFMYAEDVNLCYEARALGKKCYYIGSARVIHHGGGSSKQRSSNHWATVMQRKAILHFCRRTRGPFYGWLYQAVMAFSAAIRLLLLLPLLLLWNRKNHREAAQAAFGKWTAVLKWALGVEYQTSP